MQAKSLTDFFRKRTRTPIPAALLPDIAYVAENFRRKRAAQRVTLKDLADACGVQVQALMLVERGKKMPDLATLRAAARALDTTPRNLLRKPRALLLH